MRYVGWDADGVLVDSRSVAWKAAEEIVGLLGDARKIASQDSYREVFGRDAESALVGEEHAAVLRAMHRLIMRSRAEQVRLFEEVIEIVPKLRKPSVLVTAAFEAGIRHALSTRAAYFEFILGREKAAKRELLQEASSSGLAAYVTDGVRDVEYCRRVGIPVIAVAWGYTPLQTLLDAQPDFHARNASVTPLDTTGAGDCFVGALAAGVAKGQSWREALERANVAAAISVTRRGTGLAMPAKRAVEAYFRDHRGAVYS